MLYILLMSNAKHAKWKDALSAVSSTKPLRILKFLKECYKYAKVKTYQ